MLASRTLRSVALGLVLSTSGCLTINLPSSQITPLFETTLEGSGSAKVLLVQIEGVISETPEEPGLFGFDTEGMVGRLREELDLASRDGDVRALLLRINSPGGTATGSDLVYREINRFKRQRNVPVVAQLMGIATSGGYYVAQAADAIQAEPTTVTGSIGVVMSGVNLSGLMEKVGVSDQTLVTGAFKDAGSMLRPMAPEERDQLLSVLDDLFGRFLQVVEAGRQELTPEQIRELADGRVYSAQQALAAGLVDSIGSLDQALAEARRRAGLREARLVTYHRQHEYANNFYTHTPQPGSLARDRHGLERLLLGGPAFLYLWAPGAGL